MKMVEWCCQVMLQVFVKWVISGKMRRAVLLVAHTKR